MKIKKREEEIGDCFLSTRERERERETDRRRQSERERERRRGGEIWPHQKPVLKTFSSDLNSLYTLRKERAIGPTYKVLRTDFRFRDRGSSGAFREESKRASLLSASRYAVQYRRSTKTGGRPSPPPFPFSLPPLPCPQGAHPPTYLHLYLYSLFDTGTKHAYIHNSRRKRRGVGGRKTVEIGIQKCFSIDLLHG